MTTAACSRIDDMPAMQGMSNFTNVAQLQTDSGVTTTHLAVAQIAPAKGYPVRRCRECDTTGKVKDGKVVEKWRPSPAGAGTLCDR